MSDELPTPPPGITLMSPQEFLDRKHAADITAGEVKERLRLCIKLFHNADANWGCEMIADFDPAAPKYMTLLEWIDDGIDQLERDLALALDHIEKDDREIERLHNEIAALKSKK